ncbi:unnamed protein product [Alopecurus aequalis]
MAPRKRRRNSEACSVLAPPPTIPADLLLEIAARSDTTALIRCAATCRLLRRRILAAAFIQQEVFTGVMSQGILACLHVRRNKRLHRRRKPLVSLAYPSTPAASSFVDKNLAPVVSRRAADILWQYDPVTSRRGLIVLRRRHHLKRRESSGSDLCVYDPMTDVRTFLSEPPNISMDADNASVTSCVLLTAADGIGCFSFLLLVARMYIDPTDETIRVQTSVPSDAGDISWGPVTESICHSGSFKGHNGIVVLPGGVIHWLTSDQKILNYDVRTGKSGTMEYPHVPYEHHLTMSSDGRLRILDVRRFVIFVWEQHSDGAWSRGARIDTEEKLDSMHPSRHGCYWPCVNSVAVVGGDQEQCGAAEE